MTRVNQVVALAHIAQDAGNTRPPLPEIPTHCADDFAHRRYEKARPNDRALRVFQSTSTTLSILSFQKSFDLESNLLRPLKAKEFSPQRALSSQRESS
jgi:hypothetical protein